MNASITIDLPFPPSVNRIWRSNFSSGHVHLGQEYEKWLKQALLHWLEQRPRPFSKVTGPFCIRIGLVRPDNRRRDLDNRIKVLLDMLQKAGVVEDDCDTDEINISWVEQDEAPTGCRMVIIPGNRVKSVPTTPAQELYARGRQVLGPRAGGLITKLLKAHGGVIPLARATIEYASTKTDPGGYIGAVINNKTKNSDLRERGDAW